MRQRGGLLTLALVSSVAACTAASPTPSPQYAPLPSNAFGIPPGGLVRIESVEISGDNRVLTMRFTGGRRGPASEPCTSAYEGWALLDGDVLRVAVIELRTRPVEICPAIGYAREVYVTLAEPFTGNVVKEQSTRGLISIQRQPQATPGA